MASGGCLLLCVLIVLSVFLTPGHCGYQQIDLQSSGVQCSMSSIDDTSFGRSMDCDGAINENTDTKWKNTNDNAPNCVYTGAGRNEYWLLNLGKQYNIHRVTIYPETRWDYMKNISVLVDDTEIFRFPLNRQITYTLTITGGQLPRRGRFIRLTRSSGYVTLCELQVDECTTDSYGVDCGKTCSSGCLEANGDSTCDSFSGNCTLGCEREWWGGQCDMPCSSRCAQCDRDTGDCEECQDNFASPDCQDCTFGYYGKRCDFLCGKGCVNNNCNRQDGACTCLTGWFAPNCTECNVTRWSADCSRSCGQCAGDGSCDMDTGRCISGCLEGFDGDDCTLKVMSSITGLLVGGLLGAGALLGVSVLLAAFIIRGRQRPRDSASSDDPNRCQTGVYVHSGDIRTRDNADGDTTDTEPQPSGSSESDYTPLEIYENPYLNRPYGVLRTGRGHAASGNTQGDHSAAPYGNIEIANN